MTDPVSLPFVLNQAQIDAAIAQELPRLLKNLKMDYTNGRAPRGLSAQVTVDEASIRAAVIAHARKLVNPTFTHFAVDFQATRGEDGITANIIASNAPIAEDAAPAPSAARQPVATPVAAPATIEAPADVVEAAAGVEQPFEGEADTAETVVSEVEASGDVAAASTEEAAEPAAPAPAAARSRLFADLKRPSNEPASE